MKQNVYKLTALLAACLLLCGCSKHTQSAVDQTAATLQGQSAQAEEDAEQTETTAPQPQPEEPKSKEPLTGELEEEVPPYVSPIDFEALWRQNADIYAWLEIPGTEISYPLVQREGEDAYYLTHDIDGNSSIGGAIYTESTYNTATLDDPVTVIYGHQLYNGKMFSSLQSTYSNPEKLAELNELILYQPQRELHYEIIAAVPIDTRHILYSYDFTDAAQYQSFFDEVLQNRSLNAVIAEDASVTPDNHVVILSTCYSGDYSQRFLVIAKLLATPE